MLINAWMFQCSLFGFKILKTQMMLRHWYGPRVPATPDLEKNSLNSEERHRRGVDHTCPKTKSERQLNGGLIVIDPSGCNYGVLSRESIEIYSFGTTRGESHTSKLQKYRALGRQLFLDGRLLCHTGVLGRERRACYQAEHAPGRWKLMSRPAETRRAARSSTRPFSCSCCGHSSSHWRVSFSAASPRTRGSLARLACLWSSYH